MDSAYRPERRVEPPTGRLFPNDLLQLRPVGHRRLGDVQLTHCSPFELFFFFFFSLLLWRWARERVWNLQKPQGTLYHVRDVRTSLIHG